VASSTTQQAKGGYVGVQWHL